MTTPAATLDASLASLDQADLLTQRRQMDQVRHAIAGGDEAAVRRKDTKLREACQGFESIFLNKIWSQMRQSLPKEGYLHSKEEEFYQQMFDKELVEKMSKDGGIGLGDMLYKHLKETSERVSKTTSPTRATEPLPLDETDRFRLASQLRQARGSAQAGQDGQAVQEGQDGQDPLAAEGGVTMDENGLAQVAYAPYGDEGAPAASLGEGSLPMPELKPVPAPTIELQKPGGKPAPLQTVSFDPDMPADGTQPTALDAQAMALQSPGAAGQPLGQSLGERLSSAPVQPAAAQSRAAEAYGRADRTAKTEGRRSSMPPIVDPVQGEISSGFGWRDDPITGKQAWHSGVDIKAPEGSPVGACWDGTVVFAGNGGQYGNTVVLEHAGGWRSFYGHAKDLAVQNGQKVKAGERLATVGQTGRTTGPHLHFEIRQGGLAWDPNQVKEHLLAGVDATKKS